MYRFRAIAINDAGPSEPGEPSDPVVIDVPGVQIAPYFVQILNDTIALEHEKVISLIIDTVSAALCFHGLCYHLLIVIRFDSSHLHYN
jgi:hypothetical protein